MYLHTIRYSQLRDWNVRWRDNATLNNVLLRDILHIYKERITKEEIKAENINVVDKISYAGDVVLKSSEAIRELKVNLYKILPQTIYYSKLNMHKGAVAYSDSQVLAASAEYPCLEVDGEYNARFLTLILRSGWFLRKLEGLGIKAVMPRVSPYDLLRFSVPQIDLQEQISYLNWHDRILADIREFERKILNLKQEKQKFIEDCLFVDKTSERQASCFIREVSYKQLKDWKPIFVTSAVKSEKYETVKLSDVCLISKGTTPSKGNPGHYEGKIPWLKSGEIRKNIITATETTISETAVVRYTLKIFPKGSLVIALNGEGSTRGRVAKLCIDTTVNQACAVLYSIDNHKVVTDYLWHYLEYAKDDLRNLGKGKIWKSISIQSLRNFEFICPPITIQNEFVNKVEAIDGQIVYCEQSIRNKKSDMTQKLNHLIEKHYVED